MITQVASQICMNSCSQQLNRGLAVTASECTKSIFNCERFESQSHFISRFSMIVWLKVVFNRTVKLLLTLVTNYCSKATVMFFTIKSNVSLTDRGYLNTENKNLQAMK